MRLIPLVIASTLVVVLPSTAGATTVTVAPGASDRYSTSAPTVIVRGEPGEANDVRVERGRDGLIIRDFGARRLTGACEPLEPNAVRCPGGSVEVHLEDGDDRVQSDEALGPAIRADGGPGNDVFERVGWVDGGEGDDVATGATRADGDGGNDRLSGPQVPDSRPRSVRLEGGPGDDVLRGGDSSTEYFPGPGRDVVEGGASFDLVTDTDSEPGVDRLEGAGGDNDVLSYEGRAPDARIDLVAQTSSDGDALAGFESARGGAGRDVLIGTDGSNALFGGPGDDRLTAAGGNDYLNGGGGFDRFDAGPGNDQVDALGADAGDRDARPEPIACGPGADEVVDLYEDLVGHDCERLANGQAPHPRAPRTGALDLVVRCPSGFAGRGRRCRGTVTIGSLAAADSPLPSRHARARFSFRGRSKRVRIAAGALRRREGLTISVRYEGGGGRRVGWAVPPLG